MGAVKSKGREEFCSLHLGDGIQARSTDSPNLLCEKAKPTKGHFSSFPVSNLQAAFHNDGTEYELTAASTVPHIQRAHVVQTVSVTAVVVWNLLV